MRFLSLFAAAVLFAAVAVGTASAQSSPSGPALETPAATLAAALHCPGTLKDGNRPPVLLVPGTGLLGPENWDWGYGPALRALGIESCTVDLPGAGMGDIQVAAEYVVYGVKQMAAETGGKVSVVGYSQGGLDIRWAIKHWPEIRPLIEDFVGIAPANHGADSAAALCGLPAGCGPSIRQMSPGSKLLTALDAGPQVFPGISFTTVYSNTDGTVIPPGPRSSLTGASNISVQSICPASTVNHISMPADGVAWAVTIDALLRPGPADASRIGPGVCGTFVPGVTAETAAAKAQELTGLAFPRVLGYPPAAEPALKAYAAAPLPPATGNTGPESSGALAAWAFVACGLALLAARRRALG